MIESMLLPVSPLRLEELANLLGGASLDDRRAEPRHTFFSPVSLRTSDCPTRLLTAFSREISLSGIGLLHSMPVEAGSTAVITIVTPEIHVSKAAEAIWCRPTLDGWYLSGWRFVTAR
jgi:hypothetical protein